MEDMVEKKEILAALSNSVIKGDEDAARVVAENAIKAGVDPLEAIVEGLNKGMDAVGKNFAESNINLAEVMLAADAMTAALQVLKKALPLERAASIMQGKVVIGTVYGDIHDIGKNILAALLTSVGFEVYDLGVDVPSNAFIKKAEEIEADIIALSCLVSPSLNYQRDVITYLKDTGKRNKYFIVVGGAAVFPKWVLQIGADGSARHANQAVDVLKRLMTYRKERADISAPIIEGM